MPRLKLKVNSVLRRYLASELTDEEFKEGIQAILDEFKGKHLLHQNIGQLTCRMEEEHPSEKEKFERIGILFDQVSQRIRDDLNQRMRRGPSRKCIEKNARTLD